MNTKRFLGIIFLILFFISTASAAITFVQDKNTWDDWQAIGVASDRSVSATLGTTATAGNLLVTFVGLDKNALAIAPSGFTLISSSFSNNVDGASCGLAYKVADGTEQTISWGIDKNNVGTMWVGEYSGLATVSVLDKNVYINSGVNKINYLYSPGTTEATTQANELAIAGYAIDSSSSLTAATHWDDGYSTRAEIITIINSGTPGISIGEKVLSTAGTQTADFNMGYTNDQACMALATFKATVEASSPDVNVLYPITGSFDKISNPVIDINFSILDLDTNANNILVDLNYSSSASQGTGTIILNDNNLDNGFVCDSNDLSAARVCTYHWNISSIPTGTYYILAKASDGVQSDFSSGSGTFEVTRNIIALDANVLYPVSGNFDTNTSIIDINISVIDQDFNANAVTIDLNYSKSALEGTGTPILSGANLANNLICDSNNLFSATICTYHWNITNVPTGTYHINAKVTDSNSSDFNSGTTTFRLTNYILPSPTLNQFILVGVDGMQYYHYREMMTAGTLPNFVRLIGSNGFDGNATITGHTSTTTQPGNAELHTGLGSSVTGVTNNTPATLASGLTTFERLNSFDNSIYLGMVYGKNSTYVPVPLLSNAQPIVNWWEPMTDFDYNEYVNSTYADSISVAYRAQAFIEQYRDENFYLLAYFGGPDGAGHAYGENNIGYTNSLINVDDGLGLILDSVNEYSINPEILVSGDHGWNEGTKNHDVTDINTTTILLVSNDYNLVGNIYSQSLRKQCDIGPTTLDYFGMAPNEYLDINTFGCGSLMVEAPVQDQTNPSVTADYNIGWNKTDQNIVLTCIDAESECSAIYYRIDTNSSSRVNYGAWLQFDQNILFSADGNYALDFNAINGEGLWDDTNTIYILVDKTNPSITITPDSNTSTMDTNYLINFLGADQTSGILKYFISFNGENFFQTTDTNYLLFGEAEDTNTIYLKSVDNADNNSAIGRVSITFETWVDTDSDGKSDRADPLRYTETQVTKSGLTHDLNILVGGADTNNSFSGTKEVVFYDGSAPLMDFNFNFDSNYLDLSKIEITLTGNGIVVDLNGQLQSDENKTLYLANNDFSSLCVKNAQVTSLSEISSTCTGTNEYDFTTCLTNGSYSIAGIDCTLANGVIKVENLRYSGMLGSTATETLLNGGYSVRWICSSWSNCFNGIQNRTCTSVGVGAAVGKPIEQKICDLNKSIVDSNSVVIDTNKPVIINQPDLNKQVDSNNLIQTTDDNPKVPQGLDWILFSGIIIFILILTTIGTFFIKNNKN